MVDRLSSHLLGRHVACRSHGHALHRDGGRKAHDRLFGLSQLGQSEVEDLDAAVFGDEDVVRLEVAVNDAFLVGRGEAVRDLHAVADREPERQRPAPHSLGEGLAFEQLGDQVGNTRVSSHLEYGEDVGMIQGRRGFGFDFEAPQPVRIRARLTWAGL